MIIRYPAIACVATAPHGRPTVVSVQNPGQIGARNQAIRKLPAIPRMKRTIVRGRRSLNGFMRPTLDAKRSTMNADVA